MTWTLEDYRKDHARTPLMGSVEDLVRPFVKAVVGLHDAFYDRGDMLGHLIAFGDGEGREDAAVLLDVRRRVTEIVAVVVERCVSSDQRDRAREATLVIMDAICNVDGLLDAFHEPAITRMAYNLDD